MHKKKHKDKFILIRKIFINCHKLIIFIYKVFLITSTNYFKKPNNMFSAPRHRKTSSIFELSFTKNKNLLDQYYQLRQESYRKERGWNNFNGQENDFDRSGQILIVRQENRFIGGLRVMYEKNSEYFSNETPSSEYLFRYYLENYKNETVPKNSIVEISSIVIVEEYRNGETFKEMVKFSLDNIKKQPEAKYVICIASLASCRLYKIIANKLGYQAYIEKEKLWLKIPDPYPIASYLIYMKLRN